MFNDTYLTTTIYRLPVFPKTNNILLIGDNKRTLAEVATDFVFSSYKFYNHIIVFDMYNLFRNLTNTKTLITNNVKHINNLLKYLVNNNIENNIALVILNAQLINQDLLLKLIKQQKQNINIFLAYNNYIKKVYDIAFNVEEVIFFKTQNKKILRIGNNLCLDSDVKFYNLIQKAKNGFVVCNMINRSCEIHKTNLGLKAHLLYNNITEIIEICLTKKDTTINS